jgi:hypothetical protein
MRKKIYLAGKSSSYVFSSIQDTWHFGTDLDPRIHTLTSGSGSDSDCFFQDADKKYLLHISFWIILQRQEVIKDVTKQYKLSFLYFFSWWWRDPDLGGLKTSGSGFGTVVLSTLNYSNYSLLGTGTVLQNLFFLEFSFIYKRENKLFLTRFHLLHKKLRYLLCIGLLFNF